MEQLFHIKDLTCYDHFKEWFNSRNQKTFQMGETIPDHLFIREMIAYFDAGQMFIRIWNECEYGSNHWNYRIDVDKLRCVRTAGIFETREDAEAEACLIAFQIIETNFGKIFSSSKIQS